ncbi:MAG: MobC family plasmid mobilization relaxosome protein [Alphaproteobacteria bacterium]|nr:MobC family plasmid mobilization relaxosome protein [Alphaproteobacteria bacterium]
MTDSLQLHFRKTARNMCRPAQAYESLKATPHTSETLSDNLSDKTFKSSAQVESYVKRGAVSHNSSGLKPDKTRTVHLGIRLSTAERDILAGHAERNNLTISQYARLVLLKSPALDPHRHKLLLRAVYQLTRQGVNLNQIAKQLNSYPESSEAAEAILEIRQAYSETSVTVHHALVEGRAGNWTME